MADTTPPPDRSLTWWPIAGALVIAVLVAVVIFVVGGGDERPGAKRDDNGALTCPSAYNPDGGSDAAWVPSNASGVDGQKSLTPKAAPQHVTICAYDAKGSVSGSKTAGYKALKLAGHRALTSGLAAMTKQLSALPDAGDHTGMVVTDGRIFLLGITYDTGYVWVSVLLSNYADNGQFATMTELNPRVADAFRTGTWPS